MKLPRPRAELVYLLFILLVLLFLSGCASNQDMDIIRNDINSLRVEMLSQKREIAQIRERLSDVSKDASSLVPLRESQSSLMKQQSDLLKEVQMLRGQFEENRYSLDKTMKEMASERDLQQTRIARTESDIKELKVRAGIAAPERKADEPAQEPEKTPARTGDSDPQRLYDDAHLAYKGKKYAEARRLFDQFLKEYPKHQLIPNAHFWIGETYYAEKKYEDAILSYETVIKKYPGDAKVRGAMLKQAYSFIEMGDRKTGKVILERLIEKYPQSSEAELAEKKIAELFSKGPVKDTTKKKKKQ